MNENKLMSWAKNLDELIPNSENPQTIYDSCIQIFSSRRDFFIHMPTDFLMNLIIYIISYKKTKDFLLAKKIISNYYFIGLLETAGEYHKDSCNDCGGDGYHTCYDCDGSGSEQCDNCDGEGKVKCSECGGDNMMQCPDCDGTGMEDDDTECDNCDGDGLIDCTECKSGTEECDVCDGDGTVTCSTCYGDGSQNCDDCDGTGEIETDEYTYTIYNICSWDENFNNICELRMDTFDAVGEGDKILESSENKIVLYYSEFHSELDSEINFDKLYCFAFDKNPRLFKKTNNFAISPQYDEGDASFYTD